MAHDFNGSPGSPRYCSNGETCTNIGSIMDYFQDPTDRWSCCSNEDFAEMYNDYQPFCLEVNDDDENPNPDTSTSTTTISPCTCTDFAPAR